MIFAIDPGNKLSALVEYDPVAARVLAKMKIPNEEVRQYLKTNVNGATHLAFEMAESFGSKVWDQVFVTVFWTGRFVEAWGGEHTPVKRREVKMHLVNSPRAKDGQIRNCLIDRWGGSEIALGTKKAPGPLFGITADCWQALAIAVTYADRIGSSS